MTHMLSDQLMTFAGTKDACGILTLVGVNLVDGGKAKVAHDATALAEQYLGIAPGRYS